MRILGIAVLLFCLASSAQAQGSAETVLGSVQQSIDTSDMQLFERHVAVDALLEQGASAVFGVLSTSGGKGLPPMLSLMAASAQDPTMAAQIKKLLKQETRSFLEYGVSSGLFAGKQTSGSPSGMIAPLMRDASTGRKEIRSRAPARKSGDSWIVPAVIHDEGNGRDYKVDLRVRAIDGNWKIMEVANMNQLVAKIQKEAAE